MQIHYYSQSHLAFTASMKQYIAFMNSELLTNIQRIKAIADTGLLYSNNPYDSERYEELKEISFQLLKAISGHSAAELKTYFSLAKDYPTAKVDIRGIIVSPDKKILLVKESADNKWSLPGGWADVGYSPKEVIIKECKEETGLEVIPQRLLAVFDKKMHPHPPQLFYVYKMVFYCETLSTNINKGFDVLDVQYFGINHLPPLSEDRILKSQLELLYKKVVSQDAEVYVD